MGMSSVELWLPDLLWAKQPINLQKEKTKSPPMVYFPADNSPGSVLLYYKGKAEKLASLASVPQSYFRVTPNQQRPDFDPITASNYFPPSTYVLFWNFPLKRMWLPFQGNRAEVHKELNPVVTAINERGTTGVPEGGTKSDEAVRTTHPAHLCCKDYVWPANAKSIDDTSFCVLCTLLLLPQVISILLN